MTRVSLGAAIFSASDTGFSLYSLFEPDHSQFEWFDRNGASLGKIYEAAPFLTFALSADGRRLVFNLARIDRVNLWVLDLERNAPNQITFAHAIEADPRWRSDTRIGLTSSPAGSLRRLVEIDLAGRESVLVDEPAFLQDWSRDGRFLLYSMGVRPSSTAAVRGSHVDRCTRAHRGRGNGAGPGDQARFSPDGRWISYNSGTTGRPGGVSGAVPTNRAARADFVTGRCPTNVAARWKGTLLPRIGWNALFGRVPHRYRQSQTAFSRSCRQREARYRAVRHG